MLNSLMDAAAVYSDLPMYMAGDLNATVAELPCVQGLIQNGWKRLHSESEPTCYVPGALPSCIDIVMASPSALASIRAPQLDSDISFNPHVPLQWEVPSGTQRVFKAERLIRDMPGWTVQRCWEELLDYLAEELGRDTQ
eukprot:6460209-Amphidinium_carterae.1